MVMARYAGRRCCKTWIWMFLGIAWVVSLRSVEGVKT